MKMIWYYSYWISIVAVDDLVLQHQAISSNNANQNLIVPTCVPSCQRVKWAVSFVIMFIQNSVGLKKCIDLPNSTYISYLKM